MSGPEGELRVALRAAGGLVEACALASSRPDIARLLLEGRRPAEVAAALPRLFSICGVSQGVAGHLALEAAAGRLPDAEERRRAGAAVQAESLKVGAQRVLLEWPRLLAETPQPADVAALRAPPGAAAAAALGAALFAAPAADWLALDAAALGRWVQAGATVAARVLRAVQALPPAVAADVPLLSARAAGGALPAWAEEALAAPPGPPRWQGGPAETGPLARRHADPLLATLRAQGASLISLRLLARLRELACQLEGDAGSELAGALRLPGGEGLGWVENTRGLLVHLARLGDDRVLAYRIVAPTDWNFHPEGALARALLGWPAVDAAGLQQRADWEVASLDPCVACRVELSGA